ncbi:MAG: hypothetical protein IPL61_04375 [Myxococcales bacterium]|nr:hypothetical protein [Myxococcales bacterium]
MTSTAQARLTRRGRIRRALFWIGVAAALVIAVLLIRCRGGFGVGGGGGRGLGGGAGRGTVAKPAPTPAPRCALRVDAAGITVDGQPATIATAVTACRAAGGAEVTVAGDARQGTWTELEAALAAAAIATHVRGAGAPIGDDAGAAVSP